MKLNQSVHLAYCTNVHPADDWTGTFQALQHETLAVRNRVCPDQPFGIGLRLGNFAARELSDPPTLRAFRNWLDQNHCYVFTINGFPFGNFHGARVKEQVYMPDWTSQERLDYTKLLFDLLARLVPPGIEGSVSTLPVAYKPFITVPEELQAARDNIWKCVEHIARVSIQTERKLHLGLEPEPLCVLENTREVILFFDRLRAEHRNDPRLTEYLGINYDTCHFAAEFEEPSTSIRFLREHGIRISKIHLSNALKLRPTPEAMEALRPFAEDRYLHQVVIRTPGVKLRFHKDLPQALAHESAAQIVPLEPAAGPPLRSAEEWRVHFHIPLHATPAPPLESTADHLLAVLDALKADPRLCSHLEMETYTWNVLPPGLKERDVVDQLVSEYDWVLARLAERGFTAARTSAATMSPGATVGSAGSPALSS